MAKVTQFDVQCGGQTHRIIIDTEYLPNPDKPGAVYPPHVLWPATTATEPQGEPELIPMPRLTLVNHCGCPDPYHCSADCSGQSEIMAAIAAIHMGQTAIPSCAQWVCEFAGVAPKRVDHKWWDISPEPAKVPA
jgi:hypothetical protein